jgi:hypothetical protein
MALPIIFIHTGYSSYLEFTLRQAKFTSPSSEIILLGDDANARLGDVVRHVNLKQYSRSAAEFEKVYQHFSTNPYNYERFCLQRWLALEEFMRSSGYQEVFVCDSDVLMFADINDINAGLFSTKDAGLAVYSPECASPGISYWKLPALSEFCALLPTFYTDESKLNKIKQMWAYNRAHNILGGFSDMTAVTEFYHSYGPEKICNLIDVYDNSTFDTHINIPSGGNDETYRFRMGKKVFKWQNGVPFCFNETRKSDIRFNLIHFQGPAKYMVAFYYTGPWFKGRLKLTAQYLVLNTMAFWYKTLRIRYRFAFVFDYFFKKRQGK